MLYKKKSLRPLFFRRLPESTAIQSLITIQRVSAAEWAILSPITRYLIMVRAAVLTMTVISVLAGVLLAAADHAFYPGRLLALFVGLIAAHATNNLVNDYMDSKRGLDSDDYLRRRYGVHVLEDGLMGEAAFLRVVAATGFVALVAGGFLTIELGRDVALLMAVGAFFVVFYTWPLKHLALGELSVLLVWGPLMTAGSYYVMADTVTPRVLVLALVYGIAPTLVIMGKHLDKCDQDRDKGVHSLPVVIGERSARYLCLLLLAAQWTLLAAVIISGREGWLCLTAVSIPALIGLVRALLARRPDARPPDYPESVWPLWHSAFAFRYARDFGALLVAALAASATGL